MIDTPMLALYVNLAYIDRKNQHRPKWRQPFWMNAKYVEQFSKSLEGELPTTVTSVLAVHDSRNTPMWTQPKWLDDGTALSAIVTTSKAVRHQIYSKVQLKRASQNL